MPSCLPPIFLPSSPSTRWFFFYSEFRFLWSAVFFFCPKYSDPSKLAILRTWTPAVQVQGPFHWRVRSSLGCGNKSMFHLTRLGGRCKNRPLIWEELGDDFLHVERNRPSDDKALFEGIEVFVDWISQNSSPIRWHPSSNCIRLRCS